MFGEEIIEEEKPEPSSKKKKTVSTNFNDRLFFSKSRSFHIDKIEIFLKNKSV